jgi:hypothetical protein
MTEKEVKIEASFKLTWGRAQPSSDEGSVFPDLDKPTITMRELGQRLRRERKKWEKAQEHAQKEGSNGEEAITIASNQSGDC